MPLGSAGKWSSAGVSAVVLGLLAVPIVVLTSVSLIIRAKRRGKTQCVLNHKKNKNCIIVGFRDIKTDLRRTHDSHFTILIDSF